MDWTVAQSRPVPGNRLATDERDRLLRDNGPDEETPGEARDQREIELHSRPLAARLHGATLLVVIVVVQLAWLTTLGYAFLRLVA